MHNLTFDLDALFRSIVSRMEEESTFTHEAYNDLVDEMIEDKIDIGEIDPDDDVEEYKEQLRARWPEAEESLTTGHEQDVLDQR